MNESRPPRALQKEHLATDPAYRAGTIPQIDINQAMLQITAIWVSTTARQFDPSVTLRHRRGSNEQFETRLSAMDNDDVVMLGREKKYGI